MKIERLRRSIDRLRDVRLVPTARQTTYLRTYRTLVDLAATLVDSPHQRFLQVATAAYGWMPRIVRMDPDYLDRAVEAFTEASRASRADIRESTIEAVSDCLHSVVGASKVLHFANPDVYPIWDSKVQRVWRQSEPSQDYMSRPSNYITYAEEVHALCGQKPAFDDFYSEFSSAYAGRLKLLGIPLYVIGKVRATEASAFELSGGEYEDA